MGRWDSPGEGGRGGGEIFTGRPAIGYDHGYNGKVFYLELYLDPRYVEGFVERCLKRICKDDDGEDVFRGVWEDGDVRDFALEAEPYHREY